MEYRAAARRGYYACPHLSSLGLAATKIDGVLDKVLVEGL